ncbi:unnamed protein product [Urochloa humidicola]
MEKRIYNDPEWRKTLLETPSGFALFEINEVSLKEPDDIWVYFRNVTVAKKNLYVLGFVEFDDNRSAWDGETRPSKDLMGLIQNFCDDKNHLIVQTAELKDIIMNKLNVKCSYDPNVSDEVAWGLKRVLHEVIREEKDNITREYCLPLSKGLERFMRDNLINVSPTMLTADLISEMGLAQYLNITLKEVPKILRESFDEHVCRVGDSIENDLKYARVLSRILVPELAPKYDFSKIVSHDLELRIQEAERVADQYRKEKLTMRNRETIIESLAHLLAVPKQRDDVMTQVKLMEAKIRLAELGVLEYKDDRSMSKLDLEPLKFRRTLLETPSGFAIFDVHENVFNCPTHIWSWFTDEMEAREAVLALGFVKVRDKSIARNSCDGPGEELSRLIQKLCADKKNLIVQDDDLKSVIEEKLEVKCHTKSSTGANSLDDLFWGLKYVLHEFVPQEKDNLTGDYYLPLSKGLQEALKLFGVNALPGKMNREFISIFGYLANLEFTSASVRQIFRKSFDSRISHIGELIKDDLVYAQVTAKILIPESQCESDFFKLLPSDLAEKVTDLLEKNKAESGEAIGAHDKEIILRVLEYFSNVPKKRGCYLGFLNGGCSEEELLRIEQECIRGANDDLIDDWILSVTKPLIVEDQVDVEEAKKGTGKITVQNVEKTALEVEAMGKNKSSEVKSILGDELGLCCQDNQQIDKGPGTSLVEEDSPDKYLNTIYNEEIPNDETESNQQSRPMLDDSFDKSRNIDEFVESFAEKSVSADDDSIKHRDGCYLEASDTVKTQKQPESTSETADLVMPEEANNVDGRHYSEGHS